MTTITKARIVIMLVSYTAGFSLIVANSSWLVGLGVFLVLIAHNADESLKRSKP